MADIPAMPGPEIKFLIFSLQGALYALNLAQVAEVEDLLQMSPIPLAPACYSGALNFHGDIVAVMNLSFFLGLPGSAEPGKIVVLQPKVASLAFLVETVVRIVSAGELSYGTAPDDDFAAATLILSEGEARLLDLEVIVLKAEKEIQRGQTA